jgi:hypothetical protein
VDSGNGIENEIERDVGDEAPDRVLQLEIKIFTAVGQQVRTIMGSAMPGAHEVWWDFRIDPAYEPLEEEQEVGADSISARGPTVLPGVYQIQVDVGQTTMLGDLTVRQDPRIEVSRSDLAARQAAMMAMYYLKASVYQAGQAVQGLNRQISDVETFLQKTGTTAFFGREVAGIKEELADVDRALRQLLARTGEEGNARPARTGQQIEASTTRPTEDQLQDVERTWRDVPDVIGRLNALILIRIPALYQELDDDRIQADTGEHIEVPRRRGR